jgi:hypothetical protein
MKEAKFKEILFEMYAEAFANSTPKGDFYKMLDEVETDEFGRKIIPFMDYECDPDLMKEIIEKTLDKHKVKNDYYRKSLSTNFWIGCSPKNKKVSVK